MYNHNHEDYIDLELSRLLKSNAFTWRVPACWDLSVEGDKLLNYDAVYPDGFCNNADDILYAPTLSVAQRFMREVLGIQVEANQCFKSNGEPQYFVSYPKWEDGHFILNQLEDDDFNVKMFDTYEDALREGLKYKLKEIVSNESKRTG